MQLNLHCPSCDKRLDAELATAASTVQCPACGDFIGIPAAHVGPGVTVGGFRVERLLGEGCTGSVYLARQVSMDRLVALKVFRPDAVQNEEGMARFADEVRSLGKLDHPNIVTVFDAGVDGGAAYLAMSYVDGETVEQRVSRGGALPEKTALSVARDVAVALSYASNRHSLIHRDVKPSNIILDQAGTVRLTDLGLRKIMGGESAAVTGSTMGKVNYMSPEQTGGGVVDCRTDIYSLGATLYFMLTGSSPFGSSSPMETLMRQMKEVLADPRTINKSVSGSAVNFLTVMMARKATDRYQDWGSVIGDIDRVLAGKDPATGPLAAAATTVQVLGVAAAKPKSGNRVLSREAAKVVKSHAPARAVTRNVQPIGSGGGNGRSTGLWAAILIGVLAGAFFGLRSIFSDRPLQPVPVAGRETGQAGAVPAGNRPVAGDSGADAGGTAEQYRRAVAFAQGNPAEYAEAIRRFIAVKRAAEGTDIAVKADVEIRLLQDAFNKALTAAYTSLKERADAAATQDMAAAAALVERYAGPYAIDLREQRASLALAYRRQAETIRSEEKESAAKVSGCRANYGAALAAANAAMREGNWSRATGAWQKASVDMGTVAAGLSAEAARDVAALQEQARRWVADIEVVSRMDSAAEAEYRKGWVGRKVSHRGVEGVVQDVEQDKLIVRVGKADFEMPVPPSDARTRLELALKNTTAGPGQLRGRLLAAYVCGKREVAREIFAEISKNRGEAERFASLLADMDAMAAGEARDTAQKRVDAALATAESMAAAEDDAALENVIRQLEQSCAGTAALSNAMPRVDAMRNRAKARVASVRQWKTFSGNSFNSLRSAVCGPVHPFVRWTRAYPQGAACPVAGSDGTVYVRSWNSVAALSPADGAEKWRCAIEGDGNLRSSLAIGNSDLVYVATGSKIHAVSSSGRLRWSKPFGSSSPEWRGRSYLCIGEDDSVYCCGRMGNGNMALVKFTAEGDLAWECDTGARPPGLFPESLAVHRNGNAELSLDTVFMSVGADGKVRWDGRKAPHLRTVAIRPDGTTLRCDARGQLFTFDGGAEKARRDLSFGKALAGRVACYADGSVCVASVPDGGDAGAIRLAVWSACGELKWEYSGQQAWGGAAALVIDNRNVLYALLCGGASGGAPVDSKAVLVVLSPDGQKQSEHQIPAGVAVDVPAISLGGDGVMYVGGFGGKGVTAIGDMSPRKTGGRSKP